MDDADEPNCRGGGAIHVRGLPGSQGELGSKGTISGCGKAVVGCILVAHDGNGGLGSRKRRHGVGVKKGVNST